MTILFTELLANLSSKSEQTGESEWSATIDEDWMQGRATYGGLSAAICLKAVENTFENLPPLRSAQVSFIGPVGGEVTIKTSIMRQGRSVSFISAEMTGEKGLATQAVFCFGSPRESRIDRIFTEPPKVPTREDSKPFFDNAFGPAFSNNFECLLAQGGHPISGSKQHEHFIWVRHKDPQATDMTALLGLADMPPPAVLPMFIEFAPISSMTWMINILDTDITTTDGWWLMRSAADHAREGYSSQDMQVWNASGNLVVSAQQNVAIFY